MSNAVQLNPVSEAGDDEINLKQIVDTLLEHRKLGATVAAIIMALGLTYLLLAKPIYKADALIQIETQKSPIPELQNLTDALGSGSSQTQAEIEVIRSRSVLNRVVQEFHLETETFPRRLPVVGRTLIRFGLGPLIKPVGGSYAWGDESIDVARLEVSPSLKEKSLTLRAGEGGQFFLDDPDGQQVLTGQVGKAADVSNNKGQQVAIFVRAMNGAAGTQFRVISHRPESVVESLQQRLRVNEKGKQTGIIGLSLTGTDPALVTAILNSVANSYIRQNVELHSEQASKSLEFLDQQLPTLETEVASAESALQAYKTEKGSALDISVEGKAILDRATDVETKISNLKMQRTELKQRFTDDSPALKSLRLQQEQLEASRADIEKQLEKMPKTELETIRLNRNLEVAKDLYVQLLNKAQELKVAKAGTIGDARVIDVAVVPWVKDEPKGPLVLAFTLALALVGSSVTVFVRVALRRTLESPDAIEAQLGLPVFATIPHSTLESEAIQNSKRGAQAALLCRVAPNEPAVESLRSLRTSLHFALLEAKNNVVTIHGPTPSIGKSFVAANLAFLLADTEKSVLLIDADMRKGHIHKILDRPRSPGLSEVIAGSCSFEEAAHEIKPDGVRFLSTGKLPPNPSELLTHQHFHALVQEASKKFDFVIIDTPPTLNLADSISIGKLAGVNFLVVRGGVSTIEDARIAHRRMQQNGIRIDGVIFNDLSVVASKYKYGGYYSYNYKPREV